MAAGNLAVAIGPLGAFTTQLVPNVGASPAGTYYVVVLQLDDGTVRTEYWAVPATSPTTIAAVLTTPGTGLGNLAVTQGYVNGAVANRALDSTVVHLTGTEAITGTKQFTVPPSLPAPAGANDAANKGYVDAAVSTVGSGAYVAKAGDTMTGPLSLPSEVRYSDAGWGVGNNRNLVGRFTSSSFTLTRYARAQTYFLRSYDGSGPPKYSRYSAALHVDFPLS